MCRRSAAQPSKYTLIQLFMFREKLRSVEPMTELTERLERRGSATGGGFHRRAAAAKAAGRSRRPGAPRAGPRPGRAEPLQCLPSLGFFRAGKCPAPRRPARGLPAEGAARIQERRPARLRADDGRGTAADRRRAAGRVRILPVAPALTGTVVAPKHAVPWLSLRLAPPHGRRARGARGWRAFRCGGCRAGRARRRGRWRRRGGRRHCRLRRRP